MDSGSSSTLDTGDAETPGAEGTVLISVVKLNTLNSGSQTSKAHSLLIMDLSVCSLHA